jgi:hypothetical protein
MRDTRSSGSVQGGMSNHGSYCDFACCRGLARQNLGARRREGNGAHAGLKEREHGRTDGGDHRHG